MFDEPLVELLERDLLREHGPLVSNETLSTVLGYPSKDAFRQAILRGTIPIPIFDIENRRGKFALVRDVAAWLADQRDRAITKKKSNHEANSADKENLMKL